ncbi:ABC transporter ATP-binding protein, partial [Enterococcus faecalis]
TICYLQAYLQYINQISEPISTSSYVINSIQAAMASIDRIFVILDEADEEPQASHLETISSPNGPIVFKNVQIAYTP